VLLVNVDRIALFSSIVRLETQLWNLAEDDVRRAHGVALAWVDVMQVIDSTSSCRVRDVARALSITVGGASKVVDRIEAAHLCRRAPNPVDGRSSVIALTADGETLLGEAARTLRRTLDRLFAHVSTEELDQLDRLATKLRRSLQDPAEATDHPSSTPAERGPR
jgi:DNA-binding MarR family transcriptional regulator